MIHALAGNTPVMRPRTTPIKPPIRAAEVDHRDARSWRIMIQLYPVTMSMCSGRQSFTVSLDWDIVAVPFA